MTDIDAETAHKVIMRIHQALKKFNNGQRTVLLLSYLDYMLDDMKSDLIWAYVRELIDAHENNGIAWGDLQPTGEFHEEIIRRVKTTVNGKE